MCKCVCDYQQKAVNSEAKIVVCNWKRGTGKSDFIVKHSTQNAGIKAIFSNKAMLRCRRDEVVKCFNVVDINTNDRVTFHSSFLEVDIRFLPNKYESALGIKLDYAYFDECYPSQEMLNVLESCGVKQIFVMFTNDNVEYIDNRATVDGTFYDEQIRELMEEFASIPKSEKTTMTRERVLDMIQTMERLKSRQ